VKDEAVGQKGKEERLMKKDKEWNKEGEGEKLK
jgi:hypothetical protein